ncbi:MAG: hypothetical protein HY784_09620 [Chloroflexi bacterium]|nr:hypothetical protein [Chloroflexota bacterium]
MEAIRLNTVIKNDGEVHMTGLPYRRGEQVEMILLVRPTSQAGRRPLTARRMRASGLIGIWKERTDIGESSVYARQLREEAQHRHQLDF